MKTAFKNFVVFTKDGIDLKQSLINLFCMPIENAQLNYDVKSKMRKALNSGLDEFIELHIKLLEEHSSDAEIEFANGKKDKTKFKLIDAPTTTDNAIVKINGEVTSPKMVVANHYNIPDLTAFTNKFNELLAVEAELNCYPIKFSRFEKEKCSSIDFGALDKFIDFEQVE